LSRNDIDKELSKTSLRIYMYLLSRNEPIGPRQIMRELGLSSPSLAYYHLKRLEELGLVKRNNNGYIAVPGLKIEGYIFIGRKLIPRLILYSFIYLGLLIVEIAGLILNLLRGITPTIELIILIIFTGMTFLLLLVEGIRSYKVVRT